MDGQKYNMDLPEFHTGIVLLAAGNSRRFGNNKLMEAIGGKKIYECVLETLKTVPAWKKAVVTQYPRIMESAEKSGFMTVFNERPDDGISRSVRLGVDALCGEGYIPDAILFAVCDQPFLKAETLIRMIEGFKKQREDIVGLSCRKHPGIQGNPVIFGRKYFGELCRLEGDVGGRQIIKRHPGDVCFLPLADENELADVDTREALNTLNLQP